jgi:glutathione peroxidase
MKNDENKERYWYAKRALVLAPLAICAVAAALVYRPASGRSEEPAMAQTVYEFSAKRIDGQTESLADYKGKVLLIVNTASKCGFTPQYAGLEKLYTEFKDRGFVVLGFPCNQFGKQEPGSEQEIAAFCTSTYNVTFPMFAKIDVNGDNAHPLYKYLKSDRPGMLGSEAIKWNFTKFLIDANGKPVKRYSPQTKPEDIRADIEALLPRK